MKVKVNIKMKGTIAHSLFQTFMKDMGYSGVVKNFGRWVQIPIKLTYFTP